MEQNFFSYKLSKKTFLYFSLFLFGTIFFGSETSYANTTCGKWEDVPQEHIAILNRICEYGFIQGYNEQEYGYGKPLLRAAAATITNRFVMGEEYDEAIINSEQTFNELHSIFTDTPVDNSENVWVIKAMHYANHLGIMTGDGGDQNTFRPTESINPLETFKILFEATRHRGDLSNESVSSPINYNNDVWYEDLMKHLDERVVFRLDFERKQFYFREPVSSLMSFDKELKREEAAFFIDAMLEADVMNKNRFHFVTNYPPAPTIEDGAYTLDYVFQNEVGDVIFNGKNMGKASTGKWGIFLDHGHVAFKRCEDDICEMIYDGQNFEESDCFIIKGENFAYINSNNEVIYNREKVGEVDEYFTQRGCQLYLEEDHFAYIIHVDFDDPAYQSTFPFEASGRPQVIYDGENLGYGGNLKLEGDHFAFDFEQDGGKYVNYDGENVGEGYLPQLEGNNITFRRDVGEKTHVIYNGEDLGEGIYQNLEDDHIAFYRKSDDGKNHVIYNGKDLGEGWDHLTLEGDHVAFLRKMEDGSAHLIYDGEDMGSVSKAFPILKGNHLMYLNAQGHIILDGMDLGKATPHFYDMEIY